METRLRQPDVDVQYRRDVYTALALTGRWHPDVVIVGVDWLVDDQLDVLDWIPKVSPRSKVGVVGFEGRAGSHFDAAISRGATPLSLDLLEAVPTPDNQIDERDAPPAREQAISDENEAELAHSEGVLDSLVDPAAEPAGNIGSTSQETIRVDDAQEASGQASAPDDGGVDEGEWPQDEEESSQPVRVPWLRYEGTKRRKPPAQKDTTDETEGDPVDDDPPLLSPEEIEALLGDGPEH